MYYTEIFRNRIVMRKRELMIECGDVIVVYLLLKSERDTGKTEGARENGKI